MTTPWTLEDELNQLAETPDLASALAELGMIDAGDGFKLETVQDWHRSGAETYSLLFSVSTPSRQKLFVMKACVAYPGGQSLKEIFIEWLARRNLLDELGVSTPKLYAAGNATLIEEHIPHTLADALLGHAEHRETILPALGRTAGLIVSAGFAPIRAHDWRSRGTDVVIIDFGQDLGPPDMQCGSEAGLLAEILDNLEHCGVTLAATDLSLIAKSYESSLTRISGSGGD